MAASNCTHFKVGNTWFFVGQRARPTFLIAFENLITDALVLSAGRSNRWGGSSTGNVMESFLNKGKLATPVKIRSRLDLFKFLTNNGLEKQLKFAFEDEERKKLRGQLLAKTVHG